MSVASAGGFAARVLSATRVYRRLELMAVDLAGSSTGDETPAVDVAYGFATVADVDALERLRPGLGAIAHERFGSGERCFVGRLADEVVMARWVSLARARIAFLDLHLRLADDEAYGFDVWTAPAVRGLGVASAGGARMREALLAEGVRAMVRAVWRWNPEGTRNAANEGFVVVGHVTRIGPARLGRAWVHRSPQRHP